MHTTPQGKLLCYLPTSLSSVDRPADELLRVFSFSMILISQIIEGFPDLNLQHDNQSVGRATKAEICEPPLPRVALNERWDVSRTLTLKAPPECEERREFAIVLCPNSENAISVLDKHPDSLTCIYSIWFYRIQR